jgi:4-aminobutyrate aminotransferase-like enzyme
MNNIFNTNPIKVPEVSTKHRLIKSSVPCEGTDELIAKLQKYESRSMHGQIPIVWDKAEDFFVYDKSGNKWIDFTSTIFVTNVGHANNTVCSAIENTIKNKLLHTYAYANTQRVEYLEKLIKFAGPPFEKCFLMSAGTEATEAALKLMRLNGIKRQKKKLGVICIEGNWHGRTMGAQMMSGNISQKEWIGYLDPNIHHIPFPYPWEIDGSNGEELLETSLSKLSDTGLDLAHDICGFMLETFQGWGAVFYPKEYVLKISEICKKYGILLAFDEMQAGFARTGKKFGFEHYDVTPDLICCGKGIGSGFPLSAVIGKAEVMDLPDIGNMSSTHSANPMACAAGSATLDEIERLDLVSQTEAKGKILFEKLSILKDRYSKNISYILGQGLIYAIHFQNPDGTPDCKTPSLVCQKALQMGVLLVHTGRESIKLGPPLVITEEAIIESIEVIEDALKDSIV